MSPPRLAWRCQYRPLADNPLLRLEDNVILTPHNLAHSAECYESLAHTAVENTLRGLRGAEPVYVKNPAVLPQWRERLHRLGLRSAEC